MGKKWKQNTNTHTVQDTLADHGVKVAALVLQVFYLNIFSPETVIEIWHPLAEAENY